jgi:hypothetical protein
MRPTLAETALARENLMLDRLSAAVNAFYENPQNMQAYLAWKKNKEAKQNENHRNNGTDSGKPEQAESPVP